MRSSAWCAERFGRNPYEHGRVAGWRAGQVTIKVPDHGSTPPPNHPGSGISPTRLEADVPSGQPLPFCHSPACTRASQQFAVAFGSNKVTGLFLRRGPSPSRSGHSRRLSPSHSPRRPGVLRSGGLLSPPSSLLQPHASVSRPPAHFPALRRL